MHVRDHGRDDEQRDASQDGQGTDGRRGFRRIDERAISAQLHGTFAVTVRQGPSKTGPFRDVSGRLVADF